MVNSFSSFPRIPRGNSLLTAPAVSSVPANLTAGKGGRERRLPRDLNLEMAARLIEMPDIGTDRGRRDRALLEMIYGLGLRLAGQLDDRQIYAKIVEKDPQRCLELADLLNRVIVLNGDGSFVYTPNPDYSGPDQFTYEVSDAVGNTDTATVTITITPVNDNTPVADTESFTVAEGGTATQADLDAGSSLLDGDTDPDLPNDTLSINPVPVVDVSYGSLSLNADGTFLYTPGLDFVGTDTFTYTVEDNLGAVSNTATVTITVTGQNDPPMAQDDDVTTPEETGLTINVLADNGNGADSDVDGTLVPASTTAVAGPDFMTGGRTWQRITH